MASASTAPMVLDVPHRHDRHSPLHRAILRALGPLTGMRLLDVGCGVGLLLRAAERRGALVAGVDTAVERLEIARWALPDADLREGDVDALPFDNGTFDVVTACGGTGGTAVLAELIRVVRPGGRVAVGGWVHPAGCWAATFGEHLRRLTRRDSVPLADDPGLEAGLRAAGLAVLARGEVGCPARYPSLAAAWAAMLGSEQLLQAIRLAGERAVYDAFVASVEPAVGADGTVLLSKAFRYAVAMVPVRNS